jgi:hypothetical protein
LLRALCGNLVVAGEYAQSFCPTLNETPVVCSGLIDDEGFVVGIRLIGEFQAHSVIVVKDPPIVADNGTFPPFHVA